MQIAQLSTALPKDCWSTNELFEKFPCRLPDGVRQNILNLGVSKRYLLGGDRSPSSKSSMNETEMLDLCSAACNETLRKAHLTAKDVDYLVAAYDANPFLSPG